MELSDRTAQRMEMWENFWSEVVWGISRISAEETFEGNVRIPMQDYKSVRVAFMICANVVSTHTYTDKHTDSQFLTSYTISSTS